MHVTICVIKTLSHDACEHRYIQLTKFCNTNS